MRNQGNRKTNSREKLIKPKDVSLRRLWNC